MASPDDSRSSEKALPGLAAVRELPSFKLDTLLPPTTPPAPPTPYIPISKDIFSNPTPQSFLSNDPPAAMWAPPLRDVIKGIPRIDSLNSPSEKTVKNDTDEQNHHIRNSPPFQPGEQRQGQNSLPSFSQVRRALRRYSLIPLTCLSCCTPCASHHRRVRPPAGLRQLRIPLCRQRRSLTRLPGQTQSAGALTLSPMFTSTPRISTLHFPLPTTRPWVRSSQQCISRLPAIITGRVFLMWHPQRTPCLPMCVTSRLLFLMRMDRTNIRMLLLANSLRWRLTNLRDCIRPLTTPEGATIRILIPRPTVTRLKGRIMIPVTARPRM